MCYSVVNHDHLVDLPLLYGLFILSSLVHRWWVLFAVWGRGDHLHVESIMPRGVIVERHVENRERQSRERERGRATQSLTQ